MSDYEMTGMLQTGVVRVTNWRPATTAAQKLREHMLKPGYGGTDYGLSDEELDRYLKAARDRIGGLRQSAVIVAREMIERDQGVRLSEAEERAKAEKALREIARRESGWRP